MAKRWYYKDENGNKVPVPQYKINSDNHTKITISIVRQAVAGEGKDFTYPKTTNEATGLYQYIDNRIKNFDLSWKILD